MKHQQLCIFDDCPEGGDPCDDCKDCVYGEEYHLVDGECVLRTYDPSEKIFGAPEEVSK